MSWHGRVDTLHCKLIMMIIVLIIIWKIEDDVLLTGYFCRAYCFTRIRSYRFMIMMAIIIMIMIVIIIVTMYLLSTVLTVAVII